MTRQSRREGNLEFIVLAITAVIVIVVLNQIRTLCSPLPTKMGTELSFESSSTFSPTLPNRDGSLRILVQNLQKKPGLASSLVHKFDPDVALVQEINDASEEPIFQAKSVSKRGYGTAIYARVGVEEASTVISPHAETGGFIHKKTTIAASGLLQYVSFHGYNGQPFKNATKLVDHVEAVLAALRPGPTLFAGDFNTWGPEHLDLVQKALEKKGFHLAVSWPYPGRDFPLDHAFVRGVKLEAASFFDSEADHKGAILQLSRVQEYLVVK